MSPEKKMATDKRQGLVSEAVRDARDITAAAVARAESNILERISPEVRRLVERSLARGAKTEDVDRLKRAHDGYGETEFEEAADKGERPMTKDDKDLDLENLFPDVAEVDDGVGASPMSREDEAAGIPTLGEGDDEAPPVEDEDPPAEEEEVDEEIEISEDALKQVYEQALQAEAMVSKGFKDITGGGELDKAQKDTGILDTKKGESSWEKAEPPAKQDFTVKEARELIGRGLAENKKLREALNKAVKMIRTLGTRLSEVNLFNSKVLHVNRFLNGHAKLTTEQKRVVLSSIDEAKNIDEVKKLYKTLGSSFGATGVGTESRRKPPTIGGKQRGKAASVITEQVDNKNDERRAQWAVLAGLLD